MNFRRIDLKEVKKCNIDTHYSLTNLRPETKPGVKLKSECISYKTC